MARRRFQARVSEESHRGWWKLRRASGCRISPLVEAIGLALDESLDWIPDEVIERARDIDDDRYSR